MAGSNVPAVGVEITAKLDKFRTQMATLGPEAGKAGKQIAAQLEREWKASQKAMRDTERAAREANARLRQLVDTGEMLAPSVGKVKTAFRDTGLNATKLGMAMGPLGGVLARIDPQAGAVASTIAGLTGTMQGLGAAGAGSIAAMAPLAGALAAVALVAAPVVGWLVALQREEEEAAAWSAFLADHQDDLVASLDALEDATLRAAVATGTLTEEQGKLASARKDADRSQREFADGLEEERRAANDAFFANQRYKDNMLALTGPNSPLFKATDYVLGWSSAQEEAVKTLDALSVQEAEHGGVVADTLVQTERAIVAEGKRTKGQSAARDATRAAAEAEREHKAAMDAARRAAEQYADGLDRLAEIGRSARESNLEGIDREMAARARLLEQVDEAHAATVDAARGSEEEFLRVAEAEREAERAREAIIEASEDRVLEIRQKAADADAKLALDAAKVREAALMQVVGSSAAALGQLFGDSKAAAFATASVNAALAITQALASLPPPFGAIEAAIIGGVTAGQIAKIQSTEASFGDTPGVVRMEDGGSVRLAAGDHFAAAQTREELQRQVVGEAPEVRVIAETHYRHQSFNRFIRDNLRTHGPLGQALRGDSRVGHRGDRS